MLRPICYCEGKVYVSCWVSSRQAICIASYEHEYHHMTDTFKKSKEWFLYLPVDLQKNPVKFGIVPAFDFASGFYTPYLLIGIEDNQQFTLMVHHLDYDSLSQRFCESIQCDTSTYRESNSIPKFESMYMYDGPLMILPEGNSLRIGVGSKTMKIQRISITTNVSIEKVLFVESLCPIVFDLEQVYYVWLIVIATVNGDIFIGFIVQDHIQKVLHDKFYSIPNDLFVYQTYIPLITSIKICIHNIQGANDRGLTDNIEDHLRNSTWLARNTTVACTKRKQMLIFVKGQLKYCCTIPFCDVETIYKFPSFKETSFLVQSGSQGISILKKIADSVCVQNTWNDMLHYEVIKDAETNQSKLLLFFQYPEECKVILTNCSIESLSGNSDLVLNEDTTEIFEKNEVRKAAEEGLYQRLVAGQAALIETEGKVKEKHKLIEHVLNSLHCSSLGKCTSVNTEADLIGVIPISNTMVCESDTQFNKCTIEPQLWICDQWIARWNQDFIIGKTLKNKGNVPMSQLKEILTINGQDLIHVCKIFHCLSEMTKPDVSIALEPSAVCSIVTSFGIPVCQESSLKLTSVLSWNVPNESKDNGGISKNYLLQYRSSNFSIKMNDILENRIPNVFEIPANQQIIGLRVFQTCQRLSVKSQNMDLSDIESIFTAPYQCSPPTVMKCQSSNVLLFNSNTSLNGVNLSIIDVNRNKVEMDVYFRNDLEFNLLLYWLYDSLPDEVVILPGNLQEEKKMLLENLKEEVDLISSSLLNCSNNLLREQDSINTCTDKGNMHSQVKKEKDQLQNENFLFSVKEYQKFRAMLTVKEAITDSSVQELMD